MVKKTITINWWVISIFSLLIVMLCVQQADARDVPFGDPNTIAETFYEVRSVYAADMISCKWLHPP